MWTAERLEQAAMDMRRHSSAIGLPAEIQSIVNEVAAVWCIRQRDILSTSHAPLVCSARKEAARRLRSMGLSYPEIGSALRIHHTSALRHVNPETGRKPLSARVAELETAVAQLTAELRRFTSSAEQGALFQPEPNTPSQSTPIDSATVQEVAESNRSQPERTVRTRTRAE